MRFLPNWRKLRKLFRIKRILSYWGKFWCCILHTECVHLLFRRRCMAWIFLFFLIFIWTISNYIFLHLLNFRNSHRLILFLRRWLLLFCFLFLNFTRFANFWLRNHWFRLLDRDQRFCDHFTFLLFFNFRLFSFSSFSFFLFSKWFCYSFSHQFFFIFILNLMMSMWLASWVLLINWR